MPCPQVSCWAQGTPVCTHASTVPKKEDKVGSARAECQKSYGQCNSLSLSHDQSHLKKNEFSWKDVANSLSLANIVLGLFSIFCSFSRKSHCASWMLLMSFLLDMVIRTITRQLNIYCKSGVPFSYKGLPCPYASCVLASISLLTKGNTFILCCMASLMILFMVDQSYYPRDDVLESENWKKVVYVGGVVMLFFSPFSLTAFYCLVWSLSYIFFPDALWGGAACLKL
ncbi:transmembrane protein 269 isoform X3 [Cavia porcellus]|uniref:transmembrane protein 269 isoform X3 n=1 Tax=Cavia porcellus TaxID=10141 RepID=UPI002FE2D077